MRRWGQGGQLRRPLQALLPLHEGVRSARIVEELVPEAGENSPARGICLFVCLDKILRHNLLARFRGMDGKGIMHFQRSYKYPYDTHIGNEIFVAGSLSCKILVLDVMPFAPGRYLHPFPTQVVKKATKENLEDSEQKFMVSAAAGLPWLAYDLLRIVPSPLELDKDSVSAESASTLPC